MVNGGTPPEVHIDAELVRSLLRAQRPDLARLERLRRATPEQLLDRHLLSLLS